MAVPFRTVKWTLPGSAGSPSIGSEFRDAAMLSRRQMCRDPCSHGTAVPAPCGGLVYAGSGSTRADTGQQSEVEL